MKKGKQECDFTGCLLCKSSIKEWRPAIKSNREHYNIKKGEALFTEGEEVKGIFFINKGLVKVHKNWSEGKELILRIATNGEIVGHRGIGTDNIYPITATALEPTSVCYFPIDFFNATLKVNNDILFNMMMFFAAELKESEKRQQQLANMPVKIRIIVALIRLKNKFGIDTEGCINIVLSRQDLAAYTGTTYETLFRLMNELSDEELIKTSGKKISILKEEALKKIIEDYK